LHWLPVSFRTDFKILLLVFKALHNQTPAYICDLLTSYKSDCCLRSSDRNLLVVPKSRLVTKGDHAFAIPFSCYANSLPEDLRGAENIDIFKRRLKTHLFSLAFM
ncbi:hypothetical protein LDENG_00181120, partial [Lucifuga dentata]